MTPISIKSLGIDQESGLEQQISVTQLTIDAEAEMVVIIYRIELLSPNRTIVRRSNPLSYTRYNLPTILYNPGEIIKKAVLDENGEIITPEIIAIGGEIKLIGNMKFDLLRNSSLGQGITGLINLDINAIKGIDTLNDDLSQNDYTDLNT